MERPFLILFYLKRWSDFCAVSSCRLCGWNFKVRQEDVLCIIFCIMGAAKQYDTDWNYFGRSKDQSDYFYNQIMKIMTESVKIEAEYLRRPTIGCGAPV